MSCFKVSGATHAGMVRAKNEDNFTVCGENIILGVVCDGIGGQKNGDKASALCCEQISSRFNALKSKEKLSAEKMLLKLYEWVKLANKSIYSLNKSSGEHLFMGTTVCAAIFAPEYAVCVSAGDSRMYTLENGSLAVVTSDHTVIRDGVPRLYSAIGIMEEPKLGTFLLPAEPGRRYLIVSDGIYNSLNHGTVTEIFSGAENAGVMVNRLISAANNAGGVDNLTAIAAFAEQ